MKLRPVLACGWALAASLAHLEAGDVANPLRVWEVDFSDPAEARSWKRHEWGDPTAPLQWSISLDANGRGYLNISANRGLAVETNIAIYREFPTTFRPDPINTIVLDFEWKVRDTEVSDWVGLGIVRRGSEFRSVACMSHTRFTKSGMVFFDSEGRWISHRVAMGPDPSPRAGVFLELHDPVDQLASLRRLRVEEWPPGTIPVDKTRRPLHPVAPFVPIPLEALRRVVAGAAEDLDGDGFVELLVFDRRHYMHLYRNDGRGRLNEEVTKEAGLALPTFGTTALFVDLDLDGDLDLVAAGEFETPQFFENVAGRFRERGALSAEYLGHWFTACAADVDRDGRPDVVFAGPYSKFVPLLLVRNQGDWRFRAEGVGHSEHLAEKGGMNFSALVADLDSDFLPEIVLAREYVLHGAAGQLEPNLTPWPDADHEKAEGVVAADLNGDGFVDLVFLRDSVESSGRNRILFGDGTGSFRDATVEANLPELRAAEVALVEDFDNDGDQDLYICQRRIPNHLLLNDGAGHFHDAIESSGLADDGDCDAALAADLDQDGGQDIVVFRYGSPPRLLHNDLPRGNWLGIRVRGRSVAVGSRVRLLDPVTGSILGTQWIRAGKGFGATGPDELRFGLADGTSATVEVLFPDGTVRRLPGVKVNRTLAVLGSSTGAIGDAILRAREHHRAAVLTWRRAIARRPMAVAGLGLCALGLGMIPVMTRRGRWPILGVLLLLGLLCGSLGRVPWRGIAGFPFAVWLSGALVGAALPPAIRWLRRRDNLPRVTDIETLMRQTHDFRHAGVETRLLLSIHGRTQNLFLEGVLHAPFHHDLLKLIERFEQGSSERLLQLLDSVSHTFPAIPESRVICGQVRTLFERLRQLEGVAGSEPALQRWREATLPLLEVVRSAIPMLLEKVDRLCTCDVLKAVDEARFPHANVLAQHAIKVRVLCVPDQTRPAALIEMAALVTVLENLFSNAIRAMAASSQRRIDVEVAAHPRRLELRFSDSGPGVAAVERERLFQFRPGRRSGDKGYGLARSKEIVGSYGGEIVLLPDGPGAHFLISLSRPPG